MVKQIISKIFMKWKMRMCISIAYSLVGWCRTERYWNKTISHIATNHLQSSTTRTLFVLLIENVKKRWWWWWIWWTTNKYIFPIFRLFRIRWKRQKLKLLNLKIIEKLLKKNEKSFSSFFSNKLLIHGFSPISLPIR